MVVAILEDPQDANSLANALQFVAGTIAALGVRLNDRSEELQRVYEEGAAEGRRVSHPLEILALEFMMIGMRFHEQYVDEARRLARLIYLCSVDDRFNPGVISIEQLENQVLQQIEILHQCMA